MPIFGRRSRSVSVSRPTTPSTNSPAMMAASQAFLGTQGPQSKLATGAAAAALRSMSPANIPVSQVQTKRMVERQSSNAAQNAPRGRSVGNNLVRRSSSASMSERTFRDSSPGRPSTSGGASGGAPVVRKEEPPVPQLPDYYTNIPPIPKKSHRRSASIDELQVSKNGAAGQNPNRKSMESSASKPSLNPASAAARRVTSMVQMERTDSNGSKNFSYPKRSRPNSPPPQTHMSDLSEQEPQLPSTTTHGISQTEAHRIQHQLTQTAQQPVKKNKVRQGPLAEGSHLHTGTMGHKPTVTPLAPSTHPHSQAQDPSFNTGKVLNNARLTGQASHFPPSPDSPTGSQTSNSDAEQARSRRNQRASGTLQKQPSIVKEDWEGENDDSSLIDSSPYTPKTISTKRQTPEANVSRKIESSVTSPRLEQEHPENVIPVQSLIAPEPRRQSVSPSRSARFSNRLSADMTEGQKHEPPPRSVSPMKPALKHSASPQLLAQDLHRNRDSSLSPSEATDLSVDGTPRRKKVAHVKFDNHPAVVGIAAEADSPVSPQVASPQYQDKSKKWLGLNRKSQNRVALPEDSDDDDKNTMKPRQTLPTFSSVRSGRKQEESSPNQRILSSAPSSSASSISSDTTPATMATSISSDHAIGALIARDTEHKKIDHFSPVPPQVTSVEGTGMHSDTDSNFSQDLDVSTTTTAAQTTTSKLDTKAATRTAVPLGTSAVPSIAVLPATPGPEEELKHRDQWLVDIPGGFPSADQDALGDSVETTSSHHAVTTSQPEQNYDTPQHKHDVSDIRHERMPSIQEENSDKDSVYSDAAESLSELDGDGFGSINAIVHSPVAATSALRQSLPDSPTASSPMQPHEERSVDKEVPVWDDAGARWKDNRENAQRASLQPAANIVENTAQQTQKSPTTKTANIPVSTFEVSPVSINTSTVSPNQSPTPAGPLKNNRTDASPTLRKSMRAEPGSPSAPTLRSGVRNSQINEGQKPMRTSMRATSGPTAITTTSTATLKATPKATPQPTGTLQKTTIRAGAPPARKALSPINDESDSESSFKRRRRSKANVSGKYNMRRSMRTGGASETSPPQGGAAVRPLSPVERRPFSPVGGPMRSTLRGPTDNVATLRGNQGSEKRSSSLFGRSSKAKSPIRPASVTNFNRSRFVDSDEEEDARPKVFKSRFADSSDEEEDLRPVRGIPRKTKDDDSTDLEDSSDDEAAKGRKAAQQRLSVAVPSSPQTSERPTSPMSIDGKKKRGFFGRLRKGKDETASPNGKDTQTTVNGHHDPPTPKIKDETTAALGFRSDAEREALVEQTRQKLEAAKEQTAPQTIVSPHPILPIGGKLQRRMTPQRVLSDSWPLPPKIPVTNDTVDRPSTSDGTPAPPRPHFDRQESSVTSASSPIEGNLVQAGKKKRFPLLRKAFGLKD